MKADICGKCGSRATIFPSNGTTYKSITFCDECKREEYRCTCNSVAPVFFKDLLGVSDESNSDEQEKS